MFSKINTKKESKIKGAAINLTPEAACNTLLAMKTIPNLPYGEEPWKLFDLYLPDVAPRGTVIWFHGGGLEGGARGV